MQKEKNNKEKDNFREDTTKYGEFISSQFSWLTLKEQKRRAQELDQITKK